MSIGINNSSSNTQNDLLQRMFGHNPTLYKMFEIATSNPGNRNLTVGMSAEKSVTTRGWQKLGSRSKGFRTENRTARNALIDALKVEFGVKKTNELPKEVLSALNLSCFKFSTRPLTVRRIALIETSVMEAKARLAERPMPERARNGNLTEAEIKALNDNPFALKGSPVKMRCIEIFERLKANFENKFEKDEKGYRSSDYKLEGIKTHFDRKLDIKIGGKAFKSYDKLAQYLKSYFGEENRCLLNVFDEEFHNYITSIESQNMYNKKNLTLSPSGDVTDATTKLSIKKNGDGGFRVSYSRTMCSKAFQYYNGNQKYYMQQKSEGARLRTSIEMEFDMKMEGDKIALTNVQTPIFEYKIPDDAEFETFDMGLMEE